MQYFLRFTLGISLLLILSVHTQAAIIKGSVIDKTTGEPLTGASIVLLNTKNMTEAGLDGSFMFDHVSAGSYTLQVMLTSYEKWEQSISITNDTTINISLQQRATSLKEVQIKEKFLKGSDEQARNIEKNADELMNIMSAHTIELLPDITVANVLQRVSGVTVQRNATGEARYTTIRGMDKRYNYTLVNGIKIPSPDDKARYVPMDIFPSEIIQRLEVIKSLTPNMEADAIGGVMNLVMKDAPDQFMLHASAATGYNQTLFDRSFTQFDKTAFKENDPRRLHGAAYSATPADFSRSVIDFKNVQAKPNSMFSLSLGNRYLKDKKLGVIVSGSYQNTFKGSNTIYFSPNTQPNINNVPSLTDLEIRHYSTQETRSAIHSKVDYKFNSRNELSLYAVYFQLDQAQTRYIIDTALLVNRTTPGTGNVSFNERATLTKKSIFNTTLQGKHLFGEHVKLDYSAVYSKATQSIPDMATLKTEDTSSTGGVPSSRYIFFKSIDHSWSRTTDQDVSGYLNLTYAPTIWGKEIEFMTGGMYRHKDRTNEYDPYTLDPAPINTQQQFTTINNINYYVNNPTSDAYNGQRYTVTENIGAAYLQAKFMLGKKLQTLAGARFENTEQFYTINYDPKTTLGQTGTFNYYDVLPGIHFKYALSARENIRLSYFASITRPSFFDIVPHSTPGDYYTETGNDSLNHTRAQNIDLRYEWLPKGIDQVLIGAFYKDITNPIEYQFTPKGISSGTLRPTNISGGAVNYGAELVVTKYIRNFGASLNYTFTNSSISSFKDSRIVNSAGRDTNIYVSKTRPLQGQSQHVGNLALIYRNQKIGFNAHLTFAYTGRYIAFLSGFLDQDYWQKATSFFDFSCEKKISKHLTVYAKVNNLLNTPVVLELVTSKTPFTTLPYQNLPNSVLVQQDYYGRNYLIGIRYKID